MRAPQQMFDVWDILRGLFIFETTVQKENCKKRSLSRYFMYLPSLSFNSFNKLENTKPNINK